ncbi:MAG: alkaline phosphatase family protein [Pseudomonadota bacterium]|nr:alkaline phosphatase family protein [Pseudomonadota bacterium]
MDPHHPMVQHIRHVIVLMFENRSFDNLLGWLYDGDANPDAVHNVPAPAPGEPRYDGLTPALCETYAQPVEQKGRIERFPIRRGAHGACPRWDPREGFDAVRRQLARDSTGKATMLGFLLDYWSSQKNKLWFDPTEIVHTFDPAEAPVINTLAAEFGVSDRWFASIPSQTSINRAFSICGNSIGYATSAAFEGRTNARQTTAMVDNHYYEHLLPFSLAPAVFSEPTIWNVLCEAGHDTAADWKIYHSNVWPPHVPGAGVTSYTWKMFGGLQSLVPSPTRDPRYVSIAQLAVDLRQGTLPRFAYLEPDYSLTVFEELGLHIGDDYHPPGHIDGGERLLARVFEALQASRYWEDTLLVVLFDEHGGTFDHVAPPGGLVCPSGGDTREKGFAFTDGGVRAPALFVSKWVRPRTVLRSPTRTPFEHTALPATLLDWWGLDRRALGERVMAAPSFADVVGGTPREPLAGDAWRFLARRSLARV